METGASDIFPLMLIRTAGLPLQWPESSVDTFSKREEAYLNASAQLAGCFQRAIESFEQEKENIFPDARLGKIIVNVRRYLRKGFTDKEIKVDPYLTGQRPDLAAHLLEFNKRSLEQSDLFGKIREWYESALLTEKRALVPYASNETLRRALLFGSHALLRELPRFAASEPAQWTKKERRVADTLLKYMLRASVNTTPFSRLATVSLHPVSVRTEPSEFSEVFSATKPVATPNVGLLPFLYDVLLQEPAFYNSLKIRLNPSLQRESEQLEWLYCNGEQESFQHLAINKTLESIRVFLEKTPIRFPDFMAFLTGTVTAESDKLQSFVFQLIDYGYLEWEFPETGLLPGWCGSLYNYLGFLPSAPMLTDAAYLLQWLRTAARTLSFQPLEEAMETQREALEQCRIFFERYHSVCPDIPPEQIFYEDVADSVEVSLPNHVVEQMVHDLRNALKRAAPYRVTGFRAELTAFGMQTLQPGESMPFLSFCKAFMQNDTRNKNAEVFVNQLDTDKIGALLQFYKTDSGEYKAVLNALYPGGGKMMARWLHLFPSDAREQLQQWWPAETSAFPWQEWTNANFQPAFATSGVAVPGGRVGAAKERLRISDLIVFRQGNTLQLLEKNSRQRIVFTDLGLEAPESRPPVMQILWHLGMPYVSAAMLDDQAEWQSLENGVWFRKRLEYQSLVTRRAAWRISREVLETALAAVPGNDVLSFLTLREKILKWEVPRYFLAATDHGQPRLFDRDSPLLMQAFEKIVRDTKSEILLSEMLPAPDQWVAGKKGAGCAGEWALEFRSEK